MNKNKSEFIASVSIFLIAVILVGIGDYYLIPTILNYVHHISAVMMGCFFVVVLIKTRIMGFEIGASSGLSMISSIITTVFLTWIINYFVGTPIDELGFGVWLSIIIIFNLLVLLSPLIAWLASRDDEAGFNQNKAV